MLGCLPSPLFLFLCVFLGSVPFAITNKEQKPFNSSRSDPEVVVTHICFLGCLTCENRDLEVYFEHAKKQTKKQNTFQFTSTGKEASAAWYILHTVLCILITSCVQSLATFSGRAYHFKSQTPLCQTLVSIFMC